MTASNLASGGFSAAVPTVTVTLNINGTAYTASLPSAPTADLWMAGPIVQEWRSVIAPSAGSTAHPFLRVIFDTRVYNDGKAHVSVTVENVLNQHYEPSFGFPGLPINVRTGVTVTVGGR